MIIRPIRCAPGGRGFLVTLGILSMTASGCSVHYYDEASKAHHMWGVGHQVVQVRNMPELNKTSVITGSNVFGLYLGNDPSGFFLGAGWDSRRHMSVADNGGVEIKHTGSNDVLNWNVTPLPEK